MFVCDVICWLMALSAGAVAASPSITTCEEFEHEAYFNPYYVIDSLWKIFYFWANSTEMYPVSFSLPAKQRIDSIKAVVSAAEPGLEIEWQRAVLLMEPRPGLLVVFLSASTPGAYRALVRQERRAPVRPHPLPLIKFADVRLKIVGRYIAMMCCEDLTAYALARVDDMPPTEQACETEAAKLGIRLPDGHPYLYVKRLADEL